MSNPAHDTLHASPGNDLVAANIRAALGYNGLDQTDLAQAIGLSDMALTRRMSRKYAAEFSASEILDAATYLGVAPGELFAVRPGPRGAASGKLYGVGTTIMRPLTGPKSSPHHYE